MSDGRSPQVAACAYSSLHTRSNLPMIHRNDGNQESGNASLSLRFASINGHTTLVESYEQAPLHAALLYSPSSIAGPGSVRVATVHNGGGILAGDDINIEIVLENGAAVHLSTVGATRIHRPASGDTRPSRIATQYRVGAQSILIVLPDAIIPFAGSSLEMKTTIQVATGGTCIVGEIIAAGRVARGEVFAWRSLHTQFALNVNGHLCVLDRLHLPINATSHHSFALATEPTAALAWGQYTHLATLWICAPTGDATLAERLHHHIQDNVGQKGDLIGSATKASGPVVVARLLGHSALDLKCTLADLTTIAMLKRIDDTL